MKNISKFPRGVAYPSKQGANGNVYGVKHTWKIKNGDVETAVDKCAERIADYIKGCLENADAQVAELKLNTDRKEDRTGFKSNPMSVRDSNLLLRE